MAPGPEDLTARLLEVFTLTPSMRWWPSWCTGLRNSRSTWKP